MRAKEFVNEKWSERYKRSIDCSNPKGFSQRAHCAGRKKTNEGNAADYNTARSIAADIHNYVENIKHTLALPVPNKQAYIARLKAEIMSMVQDLSDLGYDYNPDAKDFLEISAIDTQVNPKLREQQLDELMFKGSPCTKDCSGHRAGYEWSQRRGGVHSASWSRSFNNGAAIAAAGL